VIKVDVELLALGVRDSEHFGSPIVKQVNSACVVFALFLPDWRHYSDAALHKGRMSVNTADAKRGDTYRQWSHGPNETEISHGRVPWQTHWTHFDMGPLASSIG
jgi:hypothetical protein